MVRWTSRHQLAAVLIATVVLATWVGTARMLDTGPLAMLPFIAPGGVFGVWLCWLGYFRRRSQFSWDIAFAGGIAGAVVLPPWLGSTVVVFGVQPDLLLMLFTAGAWFALLAGLLVGALGAAPRFTRSRRSGTNRQAPGDRLNH